MFENLLIARNIIKLDEVDSTNSYALNWIKNTEVAEGAVIYTLSQTKGRGQRGSTWESGIGENLIFSIILKPNFIKVTEVVYLNAAISLGILNYLKSFKLKSDIKIKWPNDIIVDKKKICGILIENTLSGLSLQSSVIGIGFNLNSTNFEGNFKATSLKLLTDQHFLMERELKSLCSYIEVQYIKLRDHYPEILSAYKENLYQLNEEKLYMQNGKTIKAKIVDVNKNGKLVLQKDSGTLISVDLKEIHYL